MIDANSTPECPCECPSDEQIRAAQQALQYLRVAEDPDTLPTLSEEARFSGIAELGHVLLHATEIREHVEDILFRAQIHGKLPAGAKPPMGSMRVMQV